MKWILSARLGESEVYRYGCRKESQSGGLCGIVHTMVSGTFKDWLEGKVSKRRVSMGRPGKSMVGRGG